MNHQYFELLVKKFLYFVKTGWRILVHGLLEIKSLVFIAGEWIDIINIMILNLVFFNGVDFTFWVLSRELYCILEDQPGVIASLNEISVFKSKDVKIWQKKVAWHFSIRWYDDENSTCLLCSKLSKVSPRIKPSIRRFEKPPRLNSKAALAIIVGNSAVLHPVVRRIRNLSPFSIRRRPARTMRWKDGFPESNGPRG